MKVMLLIAAIIMALLLCAAAVFFYFRRSRRTAEPVALDLFGAARPTFALRMPRTGRVLQLLVLSKRDCERVLDITDRAKMGKQISSDEYLQLLTEAAAIILSCNTAGRRYDARRVARLFSYDDIAAVVARYLDWLSGLATAKN